MDIFRKGFCYIYVLLIISVAVPVTAGDDQVIETILDNGMKLLTQEVHSSPLVAVHVYYRIGAKSEPPGMSGMASLCGWIMQQGTPVYAQGEIARIVQSAGGTVGYSSNHDFFVFTSRAPSELLDTILYLEADRLENTDITFEKLKLAKDANRKKRLYNIENSMYGFINQEFLALSFRSHPYHRPVLGWPDDVNNIELDHIKKYYKKYFQPDAVTLVIVGDFETKRIIESATRLFGRIISEPDEAEIKYSSPEQIGQRKSYLTGDVGVPVILLGFQIPPITDPDYTAVALLSRIMSGGESSRLYRRLVVEEQSSMAIGGGVISKKDPGLIYFWSISSYDSPLETSERLLLEELEKIKNNPVSDLELASAKNKTEMIHYQALQTINGRAWTIGFYDILAGNWNLMNKTLETVKKLTKDDILTTAQKYLTVPHRITVYLESYDSGQEEQGE
jgi:zinc protease